MICQGPNPIPKRDLIDLDCSLVDNNYCLLVFTGSHIPIDGLINNWGGVDGYISQWVFLWSFKLQIC